MSEAALIPTKVNLQTVMQHHLQDYIKHHDLDIRQAAVCRHIQSCRTEALGGRHMRCDHCGHEQILFHSCRDRHCPQCQWRATQQWYDKQSQFLLPVTYYHLVFTLPHELNAWVALYPQVIYKQLFKAVWQTLKTFASDPKRLDGQLGASLVLHTWGQQLWRHVHLHGLVPGGALSDQGDWHPASSTYLFPVRALSRYFRGAMVSALRQCQKQGELIRLAAEDIDRTLDVLMDKDWVVYAKPCIQKTQTLMAYLARYTHRTALSDQRIQSIDGDQIQLSYKDYRDHDRWKTMRLSAEELLRRFLLHVLPKGLMRIRHYGFLSNRCRKAKIAQIRARLKAPPERQANEAAADEDNTDGLCPVCHQGHQLFLSEITPRSVSPVGIASG